MYIYHNSANRYMWVMCTVREKGNVEVVINKILNLFLLKVKKLKFKLFYNRHIFLIYRILIYRNAIGCTIFLVNAWGIFTNKFEGFLTLERATYNWLWEKHGFSKSKPQIVIVWPCDVLIVIAKAKRIGNCKCFNCVGESQGIIGILGRSTTSPGNFKLRIVASRMLPMIFLLPVAFH